MNIEKKIIKRISFHFLQSSKKRYLFLLHWKMYRIMKDVTYPKSTVLRKSIYNRYWKPTSHVREFSVIFLSENSHLLFLPSKFSAGEICYCYTIEWITVEIVWMLLYIEQIETHITTIYERILNFLKHIVYPYVECNVIVGMKLKWLRTQWIFDVNVDGG